MSEEKTVNFKKTTVRELGPTLPIGVKSPQGAVGKELVVRPWRMREEKAIARALSALPDENFGTRLAIVMSVMCQRLGPVDLDQIKDIPARRLIISTMTMPDVFYAYIWLRIQAIGNEIKFNFKCPKQKCHHEFEFVADLMSTEVKVPVDETDLYWEYKLKTPVQIRGLTVEGFRMGPQQWMTAENAVASDGPKVSVIQGSIRGFSNEKTIDKTTNQPIEQKLLDSELDEITKYDLEGMFSAISKHQFGPVMAVDVTCPQCEHSWESSIDWRYESFFVVSSD